MPIVPVHNSLELVRGEDGQRYVRISQTIEIPGAETQQVLLSLKEMDDMVMTYQRAKAAVLAVDDALKDVIGGEG